MPEWTQQQLEAITARNPEILVSAAAGSGKTAVLIERVVSLLLEGMQLDRMLVMTFTNAAAEEMKERLTDLLANQAAENEHLRRQFQKLGSADISTLHSFCKRLLQQYFQAAYTDPNSSLADESKQNELYTRAQNDALDAAHEDPTDEFDQLRAHFKETEIIDMSAALYRFLMAQAAPFEWLDNMTDPALFDDLYSHPWYEVVAREARLRLEGARDSLLDCEQICRRPDGPGRYLAAILDDLAMVDLLLVSLNTPQTFAGGKPRFARLSSKKAEATEDPELTALVKDVLRAEAKALINEALALLPENQAQAQAWMAEIRATLPQLLGLAQLVKDIHARYQAYKAAETLWDFNDLEHLALKALSDEQVRQEVVSSYDALFVDEYQDISQIQEAIITRLRGADNTLFMVGDVKQSIYRFRLADPTLFLEKYKQFSQDKDAEERLITLKENFRSRRNILQAVNLVFARAMRERATEIEYDDEAMLTTLREQLDDPPVEVHLLHQEEGLELSDEVADALDAVMPDVITDEEGAQGTPADEFERAFVYEARLLARRIRELIGTPITDGDKTREIQYRDIVILLRTAASRANVLAEILNNANIPTYSDTQGEFYTQSDVRDTLYLLQTLDNPYHDIPLMSTLSSPVFGFEPGELDAIRSAYPSRDIPFHEAFYAFAKTSSKCQEAIARLDRWRLMAHTMPLDRFLSRLLRESGLYALAGAKDEGRLRRANLRILLAQAAPNPEPQNLSDFVERALRAKKQKAGDRSASLGMQENVVRIMTMHKSKGLQFPVVMVPDLSRGFSGKRFELPLLMDAQTGLALRQVNTRDRYFKDGFGVTAIRAKKTREEQSEEARLLYVAMTRAKERLIMVGTVTNLDAALMRWSKPEGDYAASAAKNMLDWVCAPLYEPLQRVAQGLVDMDNGSRFLIAWHAVYDLLEDLSRMARPLMDPTVPPGIMARDDFFQPLAPTLRIPQKSSVTALITRERLMQTEETPEVKRRALQPARALRDMPDLVGFQTLSAAQRGAAAHKVLCALDPKDFVHLEEEQMRKALTRAMDELLSRDMLTKEERASIQEADVLHFYQSDLARRMAQSGERHAEWPFTLLADSDMILQGVLDNCFVEDNAWVLVDYKTDWGEAAMLADRYRDQMRWYMRALREITGMPVKEAWLYLLRGRQAVQITEDEPIRLKETPL